MKNSNTTLVECVPNFSEGRDPGVINKIVNCAKSVPGVHVLHIDSNSDANRSVLTYVAPPQEALEAAKSLVSCAVEHIDMNLHEGEHPRLGSVDVFPFVPLRGGAASGCADLARTLAKWAGDTLLLPTFLYEDAAQSENRRNLSILRKGEYEGLGVKLSSKQWSPDFGPGVPHPTAGACVIGARWFLIAWNVTIGSTDISLAKELARRLRTSGGSKVRNRKLPALKAIGWYMGDYGRAQVSFNLLDYRQCGLLEVYQAVEEDARDLGIDVLGSELIGLIPEAALLDVGKQLSPDLPGEQLLDSAIERLGLSLHRDFIPQERIIEHRLESMMLL
jgi:glutamate formiminotransferase/formiminotetrahydrofolate cyclodeaminase